MAARTGAQGGSKGRAGAGAGQGVGMLTFVPLVLKDVVGVGGAASVGSVGL